MEFLSVVHSDVGIKKDTNQDSVLIKEASTDYGKVLLAVVCDGMGGLAKGEVASAFLVRAFSDWFEQEFPSILYSGRIDDNLDSVKLEDSLNDLVLAVNKKIADYGEVFHASLGTTVSMLLLVEDRYYIMNVGDSRVYKLDEEAIYRLTKDQTFVQREIDEGRLTKEEAATHPQRNVLLQCVGASQIVMPDFSRGRYKKNDIFMVCSDGFRHLIAEEEFYKIMAPDKLQTEQEMQNAALYCVELNKSRQEKDNISVVIVRAC